MLAIALRISEDFREAKNTSKVTIMVSYIGDDDDIIATYQNLAKVILSSFGNQPKLI